MPSSLDQICRSRLSSNTVCWPDHTPRFKLRRCRNETVSSTHPSTPHRLPTQYTAAMLRQIFVGWESPLPSRRSDATTSPQQTSLVQIATGRDVSRHVLIVDHLARFMSHRRGCAQVWAPSSGFTIMSGFTQADLLT